MRWLKLIYYRNLSSWLKNSAIASFLNIGLGVWYRKGNEHFLVLFERMGENLRR